MKPDTFQEQIFFSTVRLTIPIKSGSKISIGTGFICSAPLNDPMGKSAVLLISNRHVYVDPAQPIVLNFNKRKPDGSGPELGQVVTFPYQQFADIYTGHPDPDIDLACINISTIGEPQKNAYFRHINTTTFSDFSEGALLPGADVLFVGYPDNQFDSINNLPLLRKGCIASVPKVDFEGKKEFLIDAQIFPGSSGSPVFAALETAHGEEFKLVGIVTKTIVRDEKLQVIPSASTLGVQQIIGLGVVIKATVIKELVDLVVQEIEYRLRNTKMR